MYATLLTADDLLLRRRFEEKTLEHAAFRHREHVRLTWICLTSDSAPAVEALLCRGLRELAALHGVPERFHHTLTVAWVRIIETARRPRADSPFDALVEACPWLLEKDAPLMYYTRDVLFSDEARRTLVPPNRQPLPAV